MGYTPQQWSDLDPSFPASAARFAFMEGGIKGNSDRLDVVEANKLDAAAGDARYAPLGTAAPRANTIVWLGDSITANGGGSSVGTGGTVASPNYSPTGFWCWANNLMGHRLKTLRNAGVGGQTTAQILARLSTDVLTYKPGWCHVMAGTNDAGNGSTAAITNLTSIYDQLQAAGIRVIAGTIPPRATYTGTQRADTMAINDFVRAQGRVRTGFHVVDYHTAAADQTGVYRAGYSIDGVHPSRIGAYWMGKQLADTMSAIIPNVTHLPTDETTGAFNVLTKGRFLTGGSGALPSGWVWNNAAGTTLTPTYSKTPRTDGVAGSWQTITLPNDGSRGWLQGFSITTDDVNLAVGDTVVGTVEYRVSALDPAAAVKTQAVFCQVAQGASAIGDLSWAYNTDDNMPAVDRQGVFRTPPFVVPATGQVLLQIPIYGGGTYHFDRAAIINLSRLGYAA